MSSFSFLNPGFLWALPVAAIPVLIHFLSKRRLPEIQFPTVMFLQALEPREIRRLKLRELLLLILRTLAMLLFVCAFARPSVEPRGATTRAAAAVAVVIDDSESMGALDEQGRPRIAGARERGLAIVDAARPGDEIAITTTTGSDQPLVNRSADRVRLERTVRQIAATWLPGGTGAAVERARRFLAKSTLRSREIYLIGDFQASEYTREAIQSLAAIGRTGARIYFVPLVSSRVPNHGFEDSDPELRPGPQGKGLEMRARIANHSDSPTERIAVRARRGETLIGGGDVSLRSEEARWASLPIEWRAAGSSGTFAASLAERVPVILESDVDALPADDRWYAVLGAPRRLRVLRIVEARAGAPAPRFTALALDPLQDGSSGYAVENGTPASLLGLTRGRCDVVILEDIASLSGDAEARLRAFLREGGGLVVALGPHADPDYYGRKLFPGIVDLSLEGVERAPEGQAFEVRARAPAHPILEGLSVRVGSPLTQARLSGLQRGRPTSPKAETVVATTGGLPVIVAAPQAAVFLGSLSDDWGDLPYSGAFVPLVRGLVDHAARAAAQGQRLSPWVGRPPAARLESAPAGAVTVRGPESYRSQAAVASEGSGFRVVADAAAAAPGFYEFEVGGRDVATVAVNPDPVESDLRPISLDSLRAAGAEAPRELLTAASLRSHLRDTRQGRELWLPFLMASAIVLAAELTLGSARILTR